jgi:hypothetical protein
LQGINNANVIKLKDLEITKIFSYENQSLNRDLNPGAPEYKASHYTATFVT